MDQFFQRAQSWSSHKHDILGRYLTAWARKLGSQSDELAFVDLCAGAGQYGDGKPGSPLIAARVNQELGGHGKRLIVYACEDHEQTASELRELLSAEMRQVPPLAYVFPKAFHEVLPEIMERTATVPTFIFLDPYGIRALTKTALEPILAKQTRDATEFLVRVPPIALARMAGWLKHNPGRGAPARKVADGCRVLLKQIGLSEELLTEAANVEPEGSGPTPDRLYRSYLSSLRERFRYVRGIPIRATYEAAPRYFLVHCTDHPDGLLIMNDVASCVDDDLYKRSEREKSLGQLDCFGNARLPRVSIAAAASRLEKALAQSKTYRYRDLRMLLVEQFGPELRKKEHDRVIDRLVDDGRAQRFPANGRRDRATYRRWSPPRPDPGIDSKSSRPASSRPPLGSSRRLV